LEVTSVVKKDLYSGIAASSGFGFNVFTEDEIDKIHLATLEVLEKTGLYVGAPEAMDILEDGGAKVDREKKIAKFPPHLVEDCIRSAPHKIVLYGRDPRHDVVLEDKSVNFCTFGQGVFIMELDGSVRTSVNQDVARAALLTDAMEEVDVCERSLTAGDAPDDVAPIHEAEVVFANTAKHTVYGPGNGWRAGKIIKMAQAIVGGEENLRERPICTINCSPTSPLTLDENCCTGVMTCARAGVPCNLISMVMAGVSGPLTLSGSLVVHNSEILGAIVLHQLTCKSAPLLYGSSSLSFDLKLTTTPVGSPECGLLNAGAPRLAQKYMLPSFAAGG
jgi:trimethylamine--corrinoid protein Co-methyltransferase